MAGVAATPSDPKLPRRAFLKTAAVVGMAAVGTGSLRYQRGSFGPPDVFAQGIASSIPAERGWERLLLWTRVTPPPGYPASDVRWVLADDPGLERIVRTGTVSATRAGNGVVKFAVGGLDPGRSYWYRFEQVVDGKVRAGTEVGRAATLPDPMGELRPVRFAALSCQNWAHGYFNAHRHLADDGDLDFVVHLGDSIYADVADGQIARLVMGYPREDPTPVATTLADYRLNYEQYLSDPGWRALRAAHPLLQVWDDHEFVNGFQGGTDRDSDQIRAARQAFAEYSPVDVPSDYSVGLDRVLPWGPALQIAVQDARWYARPGDPWGDAQRARLSPLSFRRSIVCTPTVARGRADVLVSPDPATLVVAGDSHVQGAHSLVDADGMYGTQLMTGAATSRGGAAGYDDWAFRAYDTPGAVVVAADNLEDRISFLMADVRTPDGPVREHHVIERGARTALTAPKRTERAAPGLGD